MELIGLEKEIHNVIEKLKELEKNHEGIVEIDITIYNRPAYIDNEFNIKYTI